MSKMTIAEEPSTLNNCIASHLGLDLVTIGWPTPLCESWRGQRPSMFR